MKLIKKQGAGMIIYLNEEGRGIGLVNKIKAYHLQEQGLDTLQANLALGLPGDKRNYQIAIDVLNHFEMKNIRLISNNPDKISALIENNITVIERVPSLMKTNRYNKKYLQTKKEKFGHLL
jgi:3,4-dihydroxy 2-butanone 4-phosphate synthase/GTP cyclohydrolase II